MKYVHDMEIINDMYVCKGIAKALSPFDTGNLRFNAIKANATNDGFRIVYSLQNAYYIRLLEEGISSPRHIGFIANRTVPAIASYLHTIYSAKNQTKASNFKNLALQGDTYLLDAEIKSSYDQLTREQRHEQSLSTNLEQAYEGIEYDDYYEQFNPNFASTSFRMRGRNK